MIGNISYKKPARLGHTRGQAPEVRATPSVRLAAIAFDRCIPYGLRFKAVSRKKGDLDVERGEFVM